MRSSFRPVKLPGSEDRWRGCGVLAGFCYASEMGTTHRDRGPTHGEPHARASGVFWRDFYFGVEQSWRSVGSTVLGSTFWVLGSWFGSATA